jgi:hypothetical protein
MNFFNQPPTQIKLTLSEVQALPPPHRPKGLIMDLSNYLIGGRGRHNIPIFLEVVTAAPTNNHKHRTIPVTFESLKLKEDTLAAWIAFKTVGDDKTTAPAPAHMSHLRPAEAQFHPVPGGISAEQGARMMVLFRLAKMICRDGYKVQIHLPSVLGGTVIEVTGMQEGSFIAQVLEQGQRRVGIRLPTVEPSVARRVA